MLKKILFTCSLLSLAIGFSGFGEACQWGLTVPFGAVLFILGLIVTLLESETALYDAEHGPAIPDRKAEQPSTLAGPCSVVRSAF